MRIVLLALIAHGTCFSESPDPAAFLQAFVQAYNNMDSQKIAEMASVQSYRQCHEAFTELRARKVRPLLSIKVVSIAEEEGTGEIIVKTKSSLKLGTSFDFRDKEILFYVKVVGGKLRLERTRTPQIEALNQEFTENSSLLETLKQAVKARDFPALARLFDLPGSDFAGIAKGDEAAFSKLGLQWLYNMVTEPDMKFGQSSGSRKSGGVATEFQIVNAEGAVVGKYCLYLTKREDPDTRKVTFLLRMPSSRESREALARETYDFWRAAEVADDLAVVSSAGRREYTLVEPEGKLDVPAGEQAKLYLPGTYLVPLWKDEAAYEVVGGVYACPRAEKEQLRALKQKVQEWIGLQDTGKKVAFLKACVTNPTLSVLHNDAVRRLEFLGYFDKELEEEERAFWLERMGDPDVEAVTKGTVVSALCKANFSHVRELLPQWLRDNDPGLSRTAAEQSLRNDREGFQKLMEEWLENPETRIYAVRNGTRLMRNVDGFAAKVTAHFDTADTESRRLYLPYLLYPENADGPRVVGKFLETEKNLIACGPMLMQLLRGRDKRFAGPVKEFLLKVEKAPPNVAVQMVRLNALAFLCGVGDNDGISGMKKAVQAVGDDKQKQMLFLLPLAMAARKPFRKWEECKAWVDSLETQKKAGQ